MATEHYQRNIYNIDVVQWDGENIEEIIDLVGEEFVEYTNGALKVNSVDVEVSLYVAIRNPEGTFYGVLTALQLSLFYTEIP